MIVVVLFILIKQTPQQVHGLLLCLKKEGVNPLAVALAQGSVHASYSRCHWFEFCRLLVFFLLLLSVLKILFKDWTGLD